MASGTWPYHGFNVRYHRLTDPDSATADADTPWWAEIPEAPAIPPLTGETLAIVQAAAEQAIDALRTQGRRSPAAPRPSPLRGRYHRITAYLAARPVTEHTAVLSFAALEELLGGALPTRARRFPSYWTTASPGRDQGWSAAGWRAQLRTDEQAVVFTRPAAAPE